MRIINKITIQPNTPNDNKVLWLNGSSASYYNNGTWVTIGKSSEDSRELEEKVDSLDGDIRTVENEIQDINSRHNSLNTKHESLSRTVQGIAVTGGASTATNVTYNNDASGLNAENAQDAIDELQGSKIDKTSVVQEFGNSEEFVMSQKLLSKINNSLTKDKYIGRDGTIKNLGGWNATLFYVSIDNVKSFSVKANKAALCIAYYDSTLKFISGIEGTGYGLETYTEEELQNKPSNAKYVRFSYMVAPFKLELYTGNPNINDGLIEFVDNKIDTKINAVITGASAWNGKSCAFLGDSITDPIHVGTSKNYWQYLGEILGIKYKSYGQNGAQSSSMLEQAQIAHTDNSNYDAIFIFFGTNDFNSNVPIGNWYEEEDKETTKNGQTITLKHRIKREDTTTFKNRLNRGLSYIKKNFPNSQVIMMTPIHRAYAEFGSTNQQPDESFANTQGLYISDYVDAIKECANVWATELIDLNSISGLYPLFTEYSNYFHNAETDMLHPNADGHFRMAHAIAAKMNSISCLQKPQN